MKNLQEQVTVVIPVQFASKKLLGKPLVKIDGVSVLQRLYDKVNEKFKVYIATDHAEVYEEAKSFSDCVVFSDLSFRSGTDRVYHTAKELGLYQSDENRIIVNIQANELHLGVESITKLVEALLANRDADVMTLVRPLKTEEEGDALVVKASLNSQGEVTQFSRSKGQGRCRHIGIYAYRANALRQFAEASSPTNEASLQLEQLRGMAIGLKYFTVYEKQPEKERTVEDHSQAYVDEILKSQHLFFQNTRNRDGSDSQLSQHTPQPHSRSHRRPDSMRR